MAYYEERAPIGFCCVLSRLNCRPEAFFVARGGILRARHEGEIAGTQGIRRFLYFHHFECIVLIQHFFTLSLLSIQNEVYNVEI